jgi:hypothetical protein
LLLVIDSPIYRDDHSRAKAAGRSIAYYAAAGYPELASSYHPASIKDLRSMAVDSGFALVGLKTEGRVKAAWRRVARRPPATLVVGRRIRA